VLPGTATPGEALVGHDLVKKVSFAGGSANPQRILEAGVGRKSANLVFEVANLDSAVAQGTAGVIAGPVISQVAMDGILGMIDRAKADGARLVTGGSRPEGDLPGGYYIAPTVLAEVNFNSELARNEIFGPCWPSFPSTPSRTQ
jgi:aldehyde dehydrogenase (NAD+)